MNYKKIYDQLIERSQSENRKKGCGIYFECHHIIPKCLSGSTDKTNLVLLTAREHYIAHKLLCEIYPDNDKLHYALWRMMNPQNKNHIRSYNISSYEYERRKKLQREKIRKLGLSNKGKSVKHSIETREKISKAGKGRVPWNKGKSGLSRGPLSDEHKLNISKSLKNKKKPPRTEEHSKNISKALLLKNTVKSI
jgi:alpha-galactosidase/6-phospho-beta-glucosidase family protein